MIQGELGKGYDVNRRSAVSQDAFSQTLRFESLAAPEKGQNHSPMTAAEVAAPGTAHRYLEQGFIGKTKGSQVGETWENEAFFLGAEASGMPLE